MRNEGEGERQAKDGLATKLVTNAGHEEQGQHDSAQQGEFEVVTGKLEVVASEVVTVRPVAQLAVRQSVETFVSLVPALRAADLADITRHPVSYFIDLVVFAHPFRQHHLIQAIISFETLIFFRIHS